MTIGGWQVSSVQDELHFLISFFVESPLVFNLFFFVYVYQFWGNIKLYEFFINFKNIFNFHVMSFYVLTRQIVQGSLIWKEMITQHWYYCHEECKKQHQHEKQTFRNRPWLLVQLISIKLEPLAILLWSPPVTVGISFEASPPIIEQTQLWIHSLHDSTHS